MTVITPLRPKFDARNDRCDTTRPKISQNARKDRYSTTRSKSRPVL